ncbi:hypothetical protein JOF53_001377 [Crossiella equi]|uniref:Uncharacterized protein n=1 Tax=Crossiella equi TaxID=130796 RepID=A0ABS5A7F2_9PSEU|nr:hypothetical protein [Crossiella equi]MBP2472505.1 hypothetical protein [Crossiella equi]
MSRTALDSYRDPTTDLPPAMSQYLECRVRDAEETWRLPGEDGLAGRIMLPLAAARADLFFVHLDQEPLDGTMPFWQVEAAQEALPRMAGAAATTVDDPTHTLRGRRSARGWDFLEDYLRMGEPSATVGTPAAVFPREALATLATGLEPARQPALRWDKQVLVNPGRG